MSDKLRRCLINVWLFLILPGFSIGSPALAQDLTFSDNALAYRLQISQESNINRLNKTLLNPDNRLVPQNKAGQYSSLALFLSLHGVTMDLKAAGSFTQLQAPKYDLTVRELYIDKALSSQFHLTLGRKLVKWGTGYAFNPTGVIEPRKDSADPSDRLMRNQGRQIVAIESYFGESSVSIVYGNEAALNGTRIIWGANELAVRYYTFWRGVDLSLVGYGKDHHKSQFGLNFSYTSDAHWEFHGEFIGQRGSNKWYHKILRDNPPNPSYDTYPYERVHRQSRRLFYQYLLGMQYFFESGLGLMLEYYCNKEGLTRSEWHRWSQFMDLQQKQIISGQANAHSYSNFYDGLNTLSANGSMRHYGFLRLYRTWQKAQFEAITLLNLVDGSGIVLPTAHYRVNSTFDFWLRLSHFFGNRGSEFGMLFIQDSWQLGMRFHL